MEFFGNIIHPVFIYSIENMKPLKKSVSFNAITIRAHHLGPVLAATNLWTNGLLRWRNVELFFGYRLLLFSRELYDSMYYFSKQLHRTKLWMSSPLI